MEKRLFYCTESEKVYTIEEVEEMRKIAIADGDSFAVDNLADFINACLVENNGSLIEVKTVKRLFHNGKLVYSESNLKSDLF